MDHVIAYAWVPAATGHESTRFVFVTNPAGGYAVDVFTRTDSSDWVPAEPKGSFTPTAVWFFDQETTLQKPKNSWERDTFENAKGITLATLPFPARAGQGQITWNKKWVSFDLLLRCLVGGTDLADDRSQASIISFRCDLITQIDTTTIVPTLQNLIIGDQRLPKNTRVDSLVNGPYGLVTPTGFSIFLSRLGFESGAWKSGDIDIRFSDSIDTFRRPGFSRKVQCVGPNARLRYFGLEAEPGDWMTITQKPRAVSPGQQTHVIEVNYAARLGPHKLKEDFHPNPEHRRAIDAWNRTVGDRETQLIRFGGSPRLGLLPHLTLAPACADHLGDEGAWIFGTSVKDNLKLPAKSCVQAPPTLQYWELQGLPAKIRVRVEFPNLYTHDGHTLTFAGELIGRKGTDQDIELSAERDSGNFRFDLFITGPDTKTAPMFRIGSLDLGVGSLSDEQIESTRNQDDTRYVTNLGAGWADEGSTDDVADAVQSKVAIPIALLRPGAQDAVPRTGDPGRSFELLAHGINRADEERIANRFSDDPPLVIYREDSVEEPLAGGIPQASFLLQGRDNRTSDPHASQQRVVSLNLFRDSRQQSKVSNRTSVVVIDRQPMLIAQVDAPPFTGVGSGQDPSLLEVGNWSSDAIEAPSWQLRGGPDGFDLLLPAQCIGEAMERSKDIAEAPPGNLPPIDWRLSSPARMTLSPSYNLQQFPEAAWNLRRILGYPGQRAPGAGVFHLQFELLYGLSTEVTQQQKPAVIRLAELGSRLGSLRGALFRLPVWASENENHPLLSTYTAYRERWSLIYAGYQSRLAVLQPYSDTQPQGLLLESDVKFTLRRLADLVYPIKDGTPPAGSGAPVHPNGLKGGLAWGFESAAAFEELWSAPVSTAAKIANPAFSMLGGWGYQRAVFSRGKQVIHSNTAMGRVFYFSLERIGRIGVCWNAAKHVVIYERSVVPTEQFVWDKEKDSGKNLNVQNRLFGRPVIRKVDEYVEVTEADRNYPESGVNPKTCGCLRGTRFKTTIMRVNSARIHDIPAPDSDPDEGVAGFIGYTIPIWHKDDAAANPRVYPMPQVYHRCAAADGGEDVPCQLEDPSTLVFFSSTRKVDDGDTNKWAPVHGIDYSDIPPCRVTDVPAFDADLEDGEQADAHEIEPGYEPYTVKLIPSERLVNLAAGRVADGEVVIGAVIRNLTFMRARPVAAAVNVAASLVDAGKAARVQLQQTADGLQHLLDKARAIVTHAQSEGERLAAETEGFDVKQYVDGQVKKGQDRLRQVIDNRLGNLPLLGSIIIADKDLLQIQDLCKKIKEQFATRIKAQCVRWTSVAQEVLDDTQSRCLGLWRQEANAQNAILTHVQQAVTDLLNTLMAEVTHTFGETISTIDGVQGQLEFLSDKILEPFVDFDNRLAAVAASGDDARRDILAFQEKLDSDIERAEGLAGAIMALLGKVNAQLAVKEIAAKVLDGVSSLTKNILAVDNFGLEKVADWRKQITYAIGKFMAGKDDISAAINGIKKDIQAVKDAIDGLTTALSNRLNNDIIREWKGWVATTAAQGETEITGHFTDAKKLIADDVAALQTTLIQKTDDSITGLCALLTALATRINKAAGDFLSALSSKLGGELQDLVKKTNAAQLVEDLEKKVRSLQGQVQAIEGVVNHAVADAIHTGQAAVGQAEAALHHAGDSVLRTVRSFGDSPIVQGLDHTRKKVGYLLDEARNAIAVTPLAALPARIIGPVKDLIPQRLRVPTSALLDKMIPDDLKNFDLTKLVPSFGGIELGKMLPGLKMPEGARDNIKITHGLDRQAMRAWLKATTLFKLDAEQALFNIAGLRVSLGDGVFQSTVDVSADTSGGTRKTIAGSIRGDWILALGSMEVVRFRQTSLDFRDGKLHFDLTLDKVVMSELLKFLSDLINSLKLGNSGNGVGLLTGRGGTPVGVAARLSLPLPPMGGGTTAIVNLSLNAGFELRALSDELKPDFSIGCFLSLSNADAPFAISFFILGGSGYLEVGARYAPGKDGITVYTRLSIYACAMLAIAFGPINGDVFIGVGAHANLDAQTGRPVALSVGADLLLSGKVDVCEIIFAEIVFKMSISYESDQNGSRLAGSGELHIRIKICWCFTLHVSVDISMKFNTGGSGNNSVAFGPAPDRASVLAMNEGIQSNLPRWPELLSTTIGETYYEKQAEAYLNLFQQESRAPSDH